MKKRKSILKVTGFFALFSAVIIFLPVIFIPTNNPYTYELPATQNLIEVVYATTSVTRTPPQWRPPELTREQFLEDFDYLITALEENFPSFGIVYRRNGMNMLALVPGIRERILDENIEWDYLPFFDMLQLIFFSHAFGVGHLYLATYYRYFEILYGNIPRAYQRSVYGYFGERLRGIIWPNVNQALLSSNRAQFSDTHIVTEIPEEGRVAYIRVPDMFSASGTRGSTSVPDPRNIQMVDAFYSQLEGFEHLIIDLRGLTYVWPSVFTSLLISPLIDYALETTFYLFYMAGEYNVRFIHGLPSAVFSQRQPFQIEDLENIFLPNVLTEEVLEDLSHMDYHFTRLISVAPQPERRAPFDGKVWLLVDANNFSATQQLAAFFHQTGFATLVGQTTGGNAADGMIVSNFIRLPNTTFQVRYDPIYIVSADGRPWEYGTVPHHFNREGMDALQTVLALIAEGNY